MTNFVFDITLTQYEANLILLAIEAYASEEQVGHSCPNKVADALKLYEDIFDKGFEAMLAKQAKDLTANP